MRAKKTWNAPVHPGEILADELEFMEMTAAELAEKIGVPKNRLYQIVGGRRAVTADTALRLGKFLGTGPKIWLNLQKTYELEQASRELASALRRIAPYHAAVQ